jgi:hypothetical protein
LVPKNGTPDGVTGVKGLNCHFARPTTMSATKGAVMTTENSVELSAMICTPRMSLLTVRGFGRPRV